MHYTPTPVASLDYLRFSADLQVDPSLLCAMVVMHDWQVKEKDTAAFLRRCKAQGYSIVGLEQVTPPPLGPLPPPFPSHLIPPLLTSKENYTLPDASLPCACVQTSTSEALQCVRLPKRVVLLLGAEKEGIPVDLLQDVDLCVEIPQLGITRSLNVHVSGALLLWEYTRQHASLQAESGTKSKFCP